MALTIFASDEIASDNNVVEPSHDGGEAAVELLESEVSGEGEGPSEEDQGDNESEHDHGEPAREAVTVEKCQDSTLVGDNEQQPQPAAVSPTIPPQTQPSAIDLFEQIREAENTCQEFERNIVSLKEELKEAKKEFDGAVIHLRKLVRKTAWDKGSFPQAAEESVKLPDEAASVESSEVESHPVASIFTSETAAELAPSDAWRSISISVLLTPSIEGLGKKKAEALTDECPTLGKFSDLRVEAGASCVATKLPKGIGDNIGSELENRFLEWTMKNQHLFFEAEKKVAEAESLDMPPALADLIPSVAELIAAADEQHSDIACQRSIIIERSEDFEKKLPQCDCWEAGYEAYKQGDNVSDCIYIAGEKQDDWIRGWLMAGKNDEPVSMDDEDEEAEGDGGNSGAVNTLPTVSIDDL